VLQHLSPRVDFNEWCSVHSAAATPSLQQPASPTSYASAPIVTRAMCSPLRSPLRSPLHSPPKSSPDLWSQTASAPEPDTGRSGQRAAIAGRRRLKQYPNMVRRAVPREFDFDRELEKEREETVYSLGLAERPSTAASAPPPLCLITPAHVRDAATRKRKRKEVQEELKQGKKELLVMVKKAKKEGARLQLATRLTLKARRKAVAAKDAALTELTHPKAGFCYCRQRVTTRMIGCDSQREDCPGNLWYHYDCVALVVKQACDAPVGRWLCAYCAGKEDEETADAEEAAEGDGLEVGVMPSISVAEASGFQNSRAKLALLLGGLGLKEKYVAADGNCFFLALVAMLAEEKLHPTGYNFATSTVRDVPDQFAVAAAQARAGICTHLANSNISNFLVADVEDTAAYIVKMRTDGAWAGEIEAQAAAQLFEVNIVNYTVTPGGLAEAAYGPLPGVQSRATLRFCMRSSHFWATTEA
jgi:hypothetical protein